MHTHTHTHTHTHICVCVCVCVCVCIYMIYRCVVAAPCSSKRRRCLCEAAPRRQGSVARGRTLHNTASRRSLSNRRRSRDSPGMYVCMCVCRYLCVYVCIERRRDSLFCRYVCLFTYTYVYICRHMLIDIYNTISRFCRHFYDTLKRAARKEEQRREEAERLTPPRQASRKKWSRRY